MSRLESYASLLASRGVSLASLGLREVALGRVDALSAVEMLASESVPVLGGDVYIERQGRIDVAFSNWHTDRQEDEPCDRYASRSWDKSRAYISAFPEPTDGKALFVFVIGDV